MMNVGFQHFAASHSPFSAANRTNNTFDGSALRNGFGNQRQQRHMRRERMAEREREMQTRMQEYQQIERLGVQMDGIRERIAAQRLEMLEGRIDIDDDGMEVLVALTDEEMKEANARIASMNASLSAMGREVGNIQRGRVNREQIAAEREAARQQAEIEETLRAKEARVREKAESNQSEPQTGEELDLAIANESTRSLTMMSVRVDNIRHLSSTRSRLQAESTRLQGEHRTSQLRQAQWQDVIRSNEKLDTAQRNGKIKDTSAKVSQADQRLTNARQTGIDSLIRSAEDALRSAKWDAADALRDNVLAQKAMPFSDNLDNYSLMDGFHGRQSADLNGRISRIDTAIASQIGAIYRDSQAAQDELLRLSQAPVQDADEDDANDEEKNVYVPVDMHL